MQQVLTNKRRKMSKCKRRQLLKGQKQNINRQHTIQEQNTWRIRYKARICSIVMLSKMVVLLSLFSLSLSTSAFLSCFHTDSVSFFTSLLRPRIMRSASLKLNISCSMKNYLMKLTVKSVSAW